MKKIAVAAALIIIALAIITPLAGCYVARADVTAEQLIGFWQQKNMERMKERRETYYEIYFTDDNFMYVLQTEYREPEIGGGNRTYEREYDYSLDNGAFSWTDNDNNRFFPELDDFRVTSGGVVIVLDGDIMKKHVQLVKTSDDVEYRFTKEGKEEMANKQKEAREKVVESTVAFAEELSERIGLPIRVNDDDDFMDIPQSVHFSSGDVDFHITHKNYVRIEYEPVRGSVVYLSGFEMHSYFVIPCYPVDDYVIVIDDHPYQAPQEWTDAFQALNTPAL